MVFRILFILFFIFYFENLHSQNLVPNPGFEEKSRCPDDFGQISYAIPWVPPISGDPELLGPPTYFNSCNPSTKYGTYKNDGGGMVPHSGDGYIGLGFDLKNHDRKHYFSQYAEVKLLEPLKKGQSYKVKMFVCLPTEAKYSLAEIGIKFTRNMILNMDENPLIFSDFVHVKKSDSSFISDKTEWTEITGTYIAQGGEQFMTIGCFQKNIPHKKIPFRFNYIYLLNLSASYYFIDDVSVVEETKNILTEGNLNNSKFDSTKITTSDFSDQSEKSIVLRNIFFNKGESVLLQSSFAELNRLYEFLVKHPEDKIKITGHTDNVGSKESNLQLSKNRAKAVFDYLVAKGIAANKNIYEGIGDQKPIASNETEMGREQNRRVEFMFMK